MVKKRGFNENSLVSPETGNWNVASDYAKLKIMRHLYLIDEYELIATFGSSSFFEELQQYNMNTDFLKISGFRRLVKTLIMLIDNSEFAIKKKQDKEELPQMKEILKKIYSLIPILYNTTKNDIKRTQEIRIKKEDYDKIFEKVVNIKVELNGILNRSDLLFLDKEEFDPKKYKDELMDYVATHG